LCTGSIRIYLAEEDEACHFLCSFRADDEDSLISTERNR
jgi:hypothetical protein